MPVLSSQVFAAPDEGGNTIDSVAMPAPTPTPAAIKQSTDLYTQLQEQRQVRQAAQLPPANAEAQQAASAKTAVMSDVKRLMSASWVKPAAIAAGVGLAVWFLFLRRK
jgi:hypothetical protein